MTEEEIDDLSERLGDGVGCRAKRSREIEEMTIEEMEAEMRETEAIIRKRRRRGVGLLPMPLVVLMCLMVSSVDGFNAYDCSNRTNVVEAYPSWNRTPVPTWARTGRSRRPCMARSSR
jgi:hypothetical protein